MTALDRSLARLCKVLDAHGIEHDSRPAPKRTVVDASRALPLSGPLRSLYATALGSEVTIGWYTESLTLYAAADLVRRQEGYRWRAGSRDRVLSGWDPSWIAIGDVMGGDPIIAATGEPDTPLYWAMHGTGAWQPALAAPSVEVGARALAEWVEVFHGKYRGNVSGPDFVPRADAVRAIRSRVGRIVGKAIAPWLPS